TAPSHSERGRDSPAPIQLESPPGSAPVEEFLPEPSSIALPPASSGPSLSEPPEPVQEAAPEELDDPDVVARKQPAPVHIYEDPMTPAEPENVSDEMFISADTLARDEHDVSEAVPAPVPEAADEPEVAPEPVPEEDNFVDAVESSPEHHEEEEPSQSDETQNNGNENTPLPKVAPERPTPRANVLEEIPNNEPAQRDNKPPRPVGDKAAVTPDASHRRWKKFENDRRRSLSPRSKDPVKAREMLEKGVQRIRTKTMDILGYRKLQGLIENHEGVFETEAKYDEMLTALLDELESAPEEKRQSIGRPMDLKTQVLVTIRFMFRHNAQYFAAHHARAMTALISARKRYTSSSHIASGLEETADEIIS
ncbi:suppressor of tub2 mutation, partial [Elasticomyces elasticus]